MSIDGVDGAIGHRPAVSSRVLLACPAYAFAWIALYALSADAWFLPAGLRVAALWTLPRRHWAWLAAAEWAAAAAMAPLAGTHGGMLSTALAVVLPWLAHAAAAWWFVGHYERREPKGLPGMLAGLLAGSFLGAIATGIGLRVAQALDGGSGSVARDMFTIALSDYAGIVTLAPLLLLAHEQYPDGGPASTFLARGLVFAPMLGLAALTLPGMPPPHEYGWITVTLPLIWLGAACGRHATVPGIALLALGQLVLEWIQPGAWPPQQVQRVLAVSGTAALLLCARTDALREQQLALSWTVQTLEERGRALRDVANRLSTRREDESRRLGVELHDQLGQDMTAIATRLRIAERHAENSRMLRELRIVQGMVSTAQDHLREVIDHLHPLALDRFGLARALSGGPVAEMIENAGIEYRCEIVGDVDSLPADAAIALYRICQEAATNAVRHGSGGLVAVRLVVDRRAAPACLVLEISDGAGAIVVPAGRGGHGLQGIRDRAHALGADYRFNTRHGMPRHALYLELDPPDDGARAPA